MAPHQCDKGEEIAEVSTKVTNIENSLTGIAGDIKDMRSMAHAFAEKVEKSLEKVIAMDVRITNLETRVTARENHCSSYNPQFIQVQQEVKWHSRILWGTGSIVGIAVLGAILKQVVF